MSIKNSKTGLLGRYLHFLLQQVGAIPPDRTPEHEDEATRPTDEEISKRLTECLDRINKSVIQSQDTLESIQMSFKL